MQAIFSKMKENFVLQTSNITKVYEGKKAVDNVKKGDIYGLIERN